MLRNYRWVTNVRFWGRNTAISASTDRSIALWDVRTGSLPLFALRQHQSPVSDLYIESRNAFWMTSAGADGVVATWDFRKLSNLNRKEKVLALSTKSESTQVVRQPLAKMMHCQSLRGGIECSGPVTLSKGIGAKYGQGDRTVMSVGTDGHINEWDVMSGRLLSKHNTQHSNKISCFTTFSDTDNLLKGPKGKKNNPLCFLGGTITAGWDGNIKLRRMVMNKVDSK